MNTILSKEHFNEKSGRLNEEYADYLRNKSVVVVGRGGLDHLEQGDLIDSHDVVVRIHDMCPYKSGNVRDCPSNEGRHIMNVPEEWQSRIGKTCNILFFSHIINFIETPEFIKKCIHSEAKAFQSIGGKFLCAESWMNHRQPCEMFWQELYDVRYLTMEHYINTMRLIGGTFPYGGTLVVSDIIRHEIKSLYITGMPMFITRHNRDDPFGLPNSKPVNDLNFLVGLAHKYPSRVSVDSNMQEAWEIVNGSD